MNMNKEYRAELKTLRKARRKIERDYTQMLRDCSRQIKKLELSRTRGSKTTTRECQRVDRRIAILEGRLS